MEYVIVKDNIIQEHRCGQKIENVPQDCKSYEIPSTFVGIVGNDVRFFDNNWHPKSTEQLVKENLIPKEKKVSNGKIVEKTLEEKKVEGIVPLEPYEKISDNCVVIKNNKELYESDIITLEEFVNKEIRPQRNQLMNKTLKIIDQYRNEQELLKTYTEFTPKHSKQQYNNALYYLQELRAWPQKILETKDIEQAPNRPESLAALI